MNVLQVLEAIRGLQARDRKPLPSVQNRLPVRAVNEGIVWLDPAQAPHPAVRILEVLPVNFRLKSPLERKQILRAFAEVLNALKFPVQLRNHAEPLDLTGYIGQMRELAANAPSHRSHVLADYADYLVRLTRDKELVRRRFFLTLPYVGPAPNPSAADIRKTLHQNAQDLAERLNRCGLTVLTLSDVDLANLFHALLRPQLAIEQGITAADLITEPLLNLIAPDGLDMGVDYFQVGPNYSRVVMVTNYRQYVGEGWLSDLYSYSPNVAVVQHLSPTAADSLQRDISNSLGEIRHQLSRGNLSALEVKQARLKEASADYLLGQLASGSQEVLDFSMYLHLTAPSLPELNDLTAKVERMLGGAAMKTRRTRHTTQQAFDTVLPLCINRLKESTAWQMPAETVASTFPFDHAELSHSSGVLRGINKFTRNAVIIDPYHPSMVNPHEVSITTTGGGKTIEMKAVLDRSHALGDRVWVLDIEREYRSLCLARGGQWINLAPGAGNVINPLEIRPVAMLETSDEVARDTKSLGERVLGTPPPVEHANPFLAAVLRQQTLFGLVLPGITETTLAYAEEAQWKAYRQAGIDEHTDLATVGRQDWPHLGHLVSHLLDKAQTEELGMALKRWWDGAYKGIIGGYTTVDLDASFVCIDIHDLEGIPKAQPVVLYLALTYLWDEIRRDRRQRKTLAVDEMGLLKENQQALWFLWMISKRARKYGCRLKTATQQVADFLAAGYYAEAILGNAETKILGRQKESDLAALRSLIDFSEAEVALLSGMDRKEKLLMVGSQRVLVEVEVSREELRIYDQEAYQRTYGPGAAEA